MIVRTLAEGQTALIGQTDHSRLVGQFAAHWGNAALLRRSRTTRWCGRRPTMTSAGWTTRRGRS